MGFELAGFRLEHIITKYSLTMSDGDDDDDGDDGDDDDDDDVSDGANAN